MKLSLAVTIVVLALMTSEAFASLSLGTSSSGKRSLQRRVFCGLFGSCTRNEAPSSPSVSYSARTERPRRRISRAMMALGANPLGRSRVLSQEELQKAFLPVRFYNDVPVFRHGSTSLLLLQSALRNYGRLYFTYRGNTMPPHLVMYTNERVVFDTVSDSDRASLAALVHNYSFTSRYLRLLENVL